MTASDMMPEVVRSDLGKLRQVFALLAETSSPLKRIDDAFAEVFAAAGLELTGADLTLAKWMLGNHRGSGAPAPETLYGTFSFLGEGDVVELDPGEVRVFVTELIGMDAPLAEVNEAFTELFAEIELTGYEPGFVKSLLLGLPRDERGLESMFGILSTAPPAGMWRVTSIAAGSGRAELPDMVAIDAGKARRIFGALEGREAPLAGVYAAFDDLFDGSGLTEPERAFARTLLVMFPDGIYGTFAPESPFTLTSMFADQPVELHLATLRELYAQVGELAEPMAAVAAEYAGLFHEAGVTLTEPEQAYAKSSLAWFPESLYSTFSELGSWHTTLGQIGDI